MRALATAGHTLWRLARTFGWAAATVLAVGFGIAVVDALARSRLLDSVDLLCTLLLIVGLGRVALVGEVLRSGFPASTTLTPDARRWTGRTLGLVWVGVTGMLSVDLARSVGGGSEYLVQHQLGRLSLPGVLIGGQAVVGLAAIALAFAAEWKRTDGDTLRWPRHPNHAPDAAVYGPAGVRMRRLSYLLVQVLIALAVAGAALRVVEWSGA